MNLPAHLANRHRPAMAQEAVGGLAQGRGPHISIKDNRFTVVDGAGNTKPVQTLYLDVVVVDVNPHVSKTFYDPRVPYNPEEGTPPLCFSDNGQGASSRAGQPQNTSCQLCPHHVWGSKTNQQGNKTRACDDAKKIAVLVVGVGGVPLDAPFGLRIPPASLKNWGGYIKTLSGHSLEPYDAFTRITFESQGVLAFAPAPIGEGGLAYVTAEIVAATEALWARQATKEIVGKDDVAWNGAADAQKVAYAAREQIAPAPAQQTLQPPPQPRAAPAADPFGAPTALQTAFGSPPVQQDPFGGSASPAPSAEAPKTRKPRTPKPEAAPAADDGIPPFLRREAPAAAAPPVNQEAFGMNAAPPAPDDAMAAALDAAFRLPT